MKKFKKNNPRSGNLEKDKGFTIIETLFSLLFISLALLSLCTMIAYALDANRKSDIRFKILQQVESYRNQLSSKPFDAAELEPGRYSSTDNLFKQEWDIAGISPTLKLIRFSISYKAITKKSYFYKSKYIRNNEPMNPPGE